MIEPQERERQTVRLNRHGWLLAAAWTVLVALSLLWNGYHERRGTEQAVLNEARLVFDKDILFRRWNAGHGGVYVPITEETPPNPYLSHLPERDITTPSGRRLTLMNPAYMTRQVHELQEEQQGVRGHITSLRPIRPENAPDPWETEALQAFERGVTEVAAFEDIGGDPYFRLMRPMVTEERCLKCHAVQGYKLGDIRGGISVSVPTTPIRAIMWAHLATLALGHGALWVLGLAGLGLGTRRLRQRVRERERAEEALRQAHRELESRVAERTVELKVANQQLEAAIDQTRQLALDAEQANKAKGEFLANMSHEIRTPMTAILGFTNMLFEEGDLAKAPPERIKAIETIRRNGQYLLDLINDILDLSKIEAGKLEVERVRCSPTTLLENVKSLMAVRAEAKQLSLEVEYTGRMPETIQTDPTRLRQVLINLIANAIKFTDRGGVRVAVCLEDPASREPKVQFRVIDTGIGMTAEQIAGLFRPFAQGDASTTRKFGGTGLGLAISKRLAELLGGEISVESQAGAGSEFCLTIRTGPLDGASMIEQPAEYAAVATEKPETDAATGSNDRLDCRILLAEDGPDNQRLIAYVLRKAGAEVTVVENGKLAVDVALAAIHGRRESDPPGPFDVILMDMQMPVMDGYEAAGLLRQRGYTGSIIALTAHAMVGDREKCIVAGCDDYVSKPVSPRGLVRMISAVVTEREERVSAPAGQV